MAGLPDTKVVAGLGTIGAANQENDPRPVSTLIPGTMAWIGVIAFWSYALIASVIEAIFIKLGRAPATSMSFMVCNPKFWCGTLGVNRPTGGHDVPGAPR